MNQSFHEVATQLYNYKRETSMVGQSHEIDNVNKWKQKVETRKAQQQKKPEQSPLNREGDKLLAEE